MGLHQVCHKFCKMTRVVFRKVLYLLLVGHDFLSLNEFFCLFFQEKPVYEDSLLLQNACVYIKL